MLRRHAFPFRRDRNFRTKETNEAGSSRHDALFKRRRAARVQRAKATNLCRATLLPIVAMNLTRQREPNGPPVCRVRWRASERDRASSHGYGRYRSGSPAYQATGCLYTAAVAGSEDSSPAEVVRLGVNNGANLQVARCRG